MGFYWLHWIIAALSIVFTVYVFIDNHKWTALLGAILTIINVVLSFIFMY